MPHAARLLIVIASLAILVGPAWGFQDSADRVDGEIAENVAPMTATPAAREETVAARIAEQAAKVRTEQVRASFSAVEQVLDIGLSGGAVGELLREARRRAPEPVEVQRRVLARDRQIAEVKLDRVRLMERHRLAEDSAEARRLTEELATQNTYLSALEDARAAEFALAVDSAQLVELLDSRLLWIGSAPPVGPAWVTNVATGGRWIADPIGWLGVGRTLLDRLAEVPITSALVTLLVGGLVFTRFKLMARLAAITQNVGRYATDSFILTLRVLLITLLLATPLPLTLFGIGGLLVMQANDLFAQAIGNGLLAGGAVYLLLDFFRGMCRRGGLADAHFGWNDRARRTLLNNLRWLLVIEVPSALVVATCDAGGEELYRQGLGRLAFMVGSVGLTLFVARVFRPGSGVFSELMSRDGWAWRLRRPWYFGLVFLPAALTLAAAAGYYYTATEVQSRFFTTGVVVLAGTVVYSMLTRWLLVTRRRLSMHHARQRHAEQREARQRKGETDAATGEALPELDTQTVDVEAASGQTLSLLRTIVAVGVLVALWAV